jgi:hypothetical protein
VTNVFISYRRDDAAGHAGRLSDRLVARLGASRVFMDVQDIQPGQNFAQAIDQTLAQCDHLVAVVGPRWLETIQARMTSGEDFVRHEVAIALSKGLTVIPVLVGGARMPTADDLPPELAAFSRCQAVEIRDHRFDEDAAQLVNFLAAVPRERVRRALVAVAATILVALAGGWFVWARSVPQPTVDGRWVADVQKPGQRPYRVRLTLTREGDQITGRVEYPTGDAPILDGLFADGHLTFRTEHTPQFSSSPATIRTDAQLEGDRLKVTMIDDAGTATGVATRLMADGGNAAGTVTAASLPSLAYGTWTLRVARDEQGKSWDNSVLQFTSQEEASDGLLLRGRFTWRLDNVLIGTEEFAGRYLGRSRQVILEGSSVTNAEHAGPIRLAVGSYSAVLTPDERALVMGRWGSTAQNEPGYAGEWEAVR